MHGGQCIELIMGQQERVLKETAYISRHSSPASMVDVYAAYLDRISHQTI